MQLALKSSVLKAKSKLIKWAKNEPAMFHSKSVYLDLEKTEGRPITDMHMT